MKDPIYSEVSTAWIFGLTE